MAASAAAATLRQARGVANHALPVAAKSPRHTTHNDCNGRCALEIDCNAFQKSVSQDGNVQDATARRVAS